VSSLARMRARLLAQRNNRPDPPSSIDEVVTNEQQVHSAGSGSRLSSEAVGSTAHNNVSVSNDSLPRSNNDNNVSRLRAIGASASRLLSHTNQGVTRHEATRTQTVVPALPSTEPVVKTFSVTTTVMADNARPDASTEPTSKADVTYDQLNENQRLGVKLAINSNSFCLIGSAGSGKTTTVKSMIQGLLEDGRIRKHTALETTSKFFQEGMLSVAIISFTNQAVRNIRESMPENLRKNTSTMHNLLQFVPADVEDDEDEMGVRTTKRMFVPTYGTNWNHAIGEILPHIDVIAIEEAGSVSLELFELLVSALPNPEETQFIFLGDLEQLPPVFDDAVLGFKQLELPVVELNEVYRNVGIITQLAHRVLEGKPIDDKEAQELSRTCPKTGDCIQFTRFKQRHSAESACQQMGLWLKRSVKDKTYDPDKTVILIPFNVKFGTIDLNKYIMQGISERDGLEVWRVEARGTKTYHCVGDQVLHDKEYYTISDIAVNPKYVGRPPLRPSRYLTRFGTVLEGMRTEVFGDYDDFQGLEDDASAEDLLNATLVQVEDGTLQATHVLSLVGKERGNTVTLSSGNINNMIPTYAMTVHKAQGSEWQNVILILHHSHSIMAFRELLYTGITRACSNLNIMYSGNYSGKIADKSSSMLHKCVIRQKIKGNSIKEKLEYFKKRARDYIATGGSGKTLQLLEKLEQEGKL
jgi:ATP-dependent exoDNAse (exonuclease V) alpha subunit